MTNIERKCAICKEIVSIIYLKNGFPTKTEIIWKHYYINENYNLTDDNNVLCYKCFFHFKNSSLNISEIDKNKKINNMDFIRINSTEFNKLTKEISANNFYYYNPTNDKFFCLKDYVPSNNETINKGLYYVKTSEYKIIYKYFKKEKNKNNQTTPKKLGIKLN